MISVKTEKEEFEYDIHAYVTSFFPGEEIKLLIGEDKADPVSDGMILYVSKEDRHASLKIISGNIIEKNASYDLRSEQILDEWLFKQELRLFIYDSLSDFTGKTLPWGAMIGVRPVKLIIDLLKEHPDEEELRSELYRNYRLEGSKAETGIRTARLEAGLLEPFSDGSGYSLYIGIPFCPSTCLYCSFTSYPYARFKNRIQDYLNAIHEELKAVPEYTKGLRLDTVYIGGGTPSSLSADELEVLFSYMSETLPMDSVKEFTVEAGRPDSITEDKLKVMKRFNVGRISVNPQTFKDETLKLIGRHHSSEDVRSAFKMARDAGFDNINMDMILGLPGETFDDVKRSFEEAVKLSPDSLTAHSLAIKRASRMKKWIEEHGAVSGLSADKAMEAAYAAATQLDMKPYYTYRQKNMAGNLENTGFAKDGKYGLYNVVIMEEVQSIVALGAGTVSKRVLPGKITRCDTHKDVDLYIDGIHEMIERKRKLFDGDSDCDR